MAKSTKTRVFYDTLLVGGLNEADAAGVVYEDGVDEPFRLRLRRVTETRVLDARGERHSERTSEIDIIGDLSVEDATALIGTLINDISYAYEVAERRVLTANKKETD